MPDLERLSWILNRAILAGPRPQQAIENHPNVLDQNERQNGCQEHLGLESNLHVLQEHLVKALPPAVLSSHHCEKGRRRKKKGEGIKTVMSATANGCKELVDNYTATVHT